MASPNAQKSTGLRSVEAKHGIDAASIVLPGEDPAEYEALVAEYHREFPVRCASESFHVETMIRADWQKRRLEKVEAELYQTVFSESSGKFLAAALLSSTPAAKLLIRVQRQIAALESTWRRAAAEFRRFRLQNLLRSQPIPARSPKKSPDHLSDPVAELASFRPPAKLYKNRALVDPAIMPADSLSTGPAARSAV
jgi:hypothetical protein